jgi:hypothetical protein
VRVGGKAVWESGFSFPARQDITHQLFINCKPLASWLDAKRRPGAAPWINELGDAVAIVQSTGGHAANIGLDRAFFKPDGFALASAFAIVSGGNAGKPVSLITPRKFGPDKDTFKWNYLLDTTRGQVFVDKMSASNDKYPGLKALAANAGDVIETKPDGSVAVKYACVALVDEYGTETPRSLDDLRSEARKVDASLQKTTESLEKARREYVEHQEANNKGKAKKPPSGRGKHREEFDDDKDRKLYHQCIDLQTSKKGLETKKSGILSSLVFFAISLFPGENPVTAAATFIEIAREYHERWCIENSFKVVKWSFFRQVRSRRPTRRQLALVLGMMMHNFWRVFRVKQFFGFMQSSGKPVSLYDETHPWIRKPPDKITDNLIDAVSFLTRIIGIGMVSLIQERIKGGG